MKDSADLGGCYPPCPSPSADNTLLDQQNSSYPTQPHSIIANKLLTVAQPVSLVQVCQRTGSLSLWLHPRGWGVEASNQAGEQASKQVPISCKEETLFCEGDT